MIIRKLLIITDYYLLSHLCKEADTLQSPVVTPVQGRWYTTITCCHTCARTLIHYNYLLSHLCKEADTLQLPVVTPVQGRWYTTITCCHTCARTLIHYNYLFSHLWKEADTLQLPVVTPMQGSWYTTITCCHTYARKLIHYNYLFSHLCKEADTLQLPVVTPMQGSWYTTITCCHTYARKLIPYNYLLSHLCKEVNTLQFCGTAQNTELLPTQTTTRTNLLSWFIVFTAYVQQVLNFENVSSSCVRTHLDQRHWHGLERFRYDFKGRNYSFYSFLSPWKSMMFHFVSKAFTSHQKTVFGAKWWSITQSLTSSQC